MNARSSKCPSLEAIVGSSSIITQMRQEIQSVSSYNVNVLTTGPTGSGKELVAQALHAASKRKGKLISVNCAAIPRDLLEAELFGHEKGAFTGATARRKGRFEDAAGGTLFLDEIGDMPLELQSKLLRVIETRKISRLGSSAEHPLDFRLVCATHKNLDDKLNKGEFREDLLYRLSVVSIHVPPLKMRVEDIPELIVTISAQMENDGSGLTPPRVQLDGMEELMRYDWPGNVRELKNFLQRAAIFSRGKPLTRSVVRRLLHRDENRGKEQTVICNAFEKVSGLTEQNITMQQCPMPIKLQKCTTCATPKLSSNQRIDLKTYLESVELNYINTALDIADSNVTKAAHLLSLKRTTLLAKMRKYKIFRE